MHKIFMPTDLIDQDDANALIIYALLQILLYYGNGEVIICLETIGKKLDFEIPLTRRRKETIVKSLDCLVDMGYIKKVDKFYAVNTNLFYDYDKYISCSRFVFDELYAAPNLFRHYLILKDCEGKDYSLEYYADREGVTTQTIINRNKDLAALNLIEVHTTTYNPADGKRNCNNIYTCLN